MNYPRRHKHTNGYVMLQLPCGSRQYEHRYVVERALGRKLSNREIVHHKDGDKGNNNLDNLQVMSRSAHTAEHNPLSPRISMTCPVCSTKFERRRKRVEWSHRRGTFVFFCSKTCSSTHKQIVRRAQLTKEQHELHHEHRFDLP